MTAKTMLSLGALFLGALLMAAVVLFSLVSGYAIAKSHYERLMVEQMEKQNAALQERNQQLKAAQAKLDQALRDASALRRNAARLRVIADSRANADSQSGDDRLARCERLLGEGAELVGEGAEVSARAVNLQQ